MALDATLAHPQYKALLAVLGTEQAAKEAFDRLPKPEVDPRIQALIDSGTGYTEETAKIALGLAPAQQTAPAPAPEPQPAPEPAFDAKVFAESKGFTTTKGRVYGGQALCEALARVLKHGRPEIVTSSGVGRTAAVLVFRTDSGDAAMQNLVKATA